MPLTSWRSRLASALDGVGALQLGLRMRAAALQRRGLTVLCYHRVNDPSAIGDLDPEMVDATPEAFDRQMQACREYFAPVTLDDVLAASADPIRHPLPPNAVLVTFDDGYRDNLEVAVPILRKHNIRASFFVATGYTNNRHVFWWERLRIMVARAKTSKFSIGYPVPFSTPLESAEHRRRATRYLLRLVKDRYDLDLDRLYDEVATATGVRWTAGDDERYASTILDWEGVRALEDAGMDVASHTREHRILQTLRPDCLARELADSKTDLEARLGHPVRALAYPVGKRITAFPEVRAAVRGAGYQLGFVVRPGINDFAAGRADFYDLHRIPVDRDWSMATFRATLLHHAFAASVLLHHAVDASAVLDALALSV